MSKSKKVKRFIAAAKAAKRLKILNDRKHAKNRAWERYGLNLTTIELKQLAERIRKGEGKQEHVTNSRRVVVIEVDGETAKVIYSDKTKDVVTFLPMRNSQTVAE